MRQSAIRKISALLLAAVILFPMILGSCGSKKEKIIIYTSLEDYRIAHMQEILNEKFPDYKITIEYLSTGTHATKLIAEGKNTLCDITFNLEYSYLSKLEKAGLLADLSSYDMSKFSDDLVISDYFMPQEKSGCGIILNTKVLKDKGLERPTSYADLLKPAYKNLISMPSPKSSGTGYVFLKNLVNVMGEDEAFKYFAELSKNILSFTTSGSQPVNELVQGSVAIGFGMISNAVTKINSGSTDLEIVFFEEGAPYSMYGCGMVEGKETREAVKNVFDYIYDEYIALHCETFYPEKIFKDKDFANNFPNYPQDIEYADMSGNTIDEKERLNEKWKHY